MSNIAQTQSDGYGRFRRAALVLTIGLCSVYALSASAGHRHHGSRSTAHFEQMDANKDGNLTQAEVDAFRAERATAMDSNGDGVVTFEEAKAARQAKREERARARFMRQDANGDGVVTVDEIGSRADQMFERLDSNADGVISADELPKRGRHHGRRHRQAEGE